jgi:hypothetical protein
MTAMQRLAGLYSVSDKISWLGVRGSPTTNNLPLRSQSFTEFGRKQTMVMLSVHPDEAYFFS